MKINKKLSAIVLSTVFAAMQVSANTITNFDTGLGAANGGAVINTATGGIIDITKSTNQADLNFNGNAHVNWNTLNVDQGQTLNFNAVGASGLTILNTVNYGMSTFAGNVNANSGIKNLIISNPNGMLFDGARFTTAGDCNLTTTTKNMMGVDVNNITDGQYTKLVDDAGKLIPIKIRNNSVFNIGGDYTILAPVIDATASTVTAKNFKLVTANGQDYVDLGVVDKKPVNNTGVTFLQAMNVNGDIIVTNDVGAFDIIDGGNYKGNMTVTAAGNTYLNYENTAGKKLVVDGDLNVSSTGVQAFIRDTEVKNNLTAQNDGGFLDVGNIKVGGDAKLTTTGARDTVDLYQHFVHVIGDSSVDGDLTINSSKNIHIGGYDYDANKLAEGKLTVGGDLKAYSTGGHVMTTIDTKAKTIDFKSTTHNVLTDDKAVLTADEYKFASSGYIGGIKGYTDENGDFISADQQIVNLMENYIPIPASAEHAAYTNIAGGKITEISTPVTDANGNRVQTYIASNGDMQLTGANAGDINLTAYGKRIDITGPDVHAKNINVGDETNYLKVDFPSRDYTLNYTNIRDGVVVKVNPNDEITYNLTDGANGYNRPTLTPGAHTTYLIGPGAPVPDKPPVNSDENARNLKGRWVPEDATAAPVNTPVAFAADLDDDELDKAVRKNVDGSVTVVRAFPMMN